LLKDAKIYSKLVNNMEIRPFRKINDSFKKIIITKDIVPSYYDENGILTMNIYDFLSDAKSLEK